MATPTAKDWATIATLIDGFESARRGSNHTNLADFLPEPTHPFHREVAAELVRVDLEYSWTDGMRKSLEDYREIVPDVFLEPSLLAGAAFEEYRLRRLAGDRTAASEYAERFGVSVAGWPEIEPTENGWHDGDRDGVALRFPQPGGRFAGFTLVSVMGRGAFATVFLAEQADLARRHVALKITSRRTLEPQHLARLQHTNIVPIYSVHESNGLLAVCMPYFGERTLADVIAGLAGGEQLPNSGQAFLSTIAGASEDTMLGKPQQPADESDQAVARRDSSAPIEVMASMSYVDSVLNLAAGIAAGLEHAHQRGIVHRDVKPANVLVTADGRPLLLDFNLSNELVVNGKESLIVGGTLPYMAPEHLRAVRDGGSVDARSDLFSLGVILYELLTGRRPFPVRRGDLDRSLGEMIDDRSGRPPSVRRHNGSVPPSVDAVVRKCLEPDVDRRYRTVRALGEDLHRHLHNLPLQHAANPSVAERLGKWRRRHPRLMSAGSLAAATLTLLIAFAALWTVRGRYVARLEAERQYAHFVGRLPSARVAVSLPGIEDELLAQGIEEVAGAIRPYKLPEAEDWRALPGYANLPPADRVRLKEQMVELAYLAARGESQLAGHARDESGARGHLERAMRFNDIAVQCMGAGSERNAVTRQRNELLVNLGRRPESSPSSSRHAPSPIGDYLEVQSCLEKCDYERAESILESLRRQHPSDPVVWLLMGNVKAALGRLPEAEGCYTAAVSLAPESYVATYNRAMCRADLKEFGGAFEDYERVLELRPDLPCVLLNRALAYETSGDLRGALADLDSAIAGGNVPPRAYFVRSRVRGKLGDAAGAEADRLEGMKHEPRDDVGWVARGTARLRDDPHGALEDFRKALELNARSRLAVKNIVHVTADRLNRHEEALDALNHWLEIDPANPSALIGRAVLKGRLGSRDEALADVEAALRSSKDPTILFQAACALSLTASSENRDAARGLLMLSRAVELDPRLMPRAEMDPDLRALRELPEYARLAATTRDLRQVKQSLINASKSAGQ